MRVLGGSRGALCGTVFFVVWACGVPTPPAPFDPGDGTPTPISLSAGDRVRYVLDWSWDGAREQDGALVFTTDLGYEVGIESLELAVFSAQLVTCEPTASRWRWGPTAAYADHVTQDDPSVIEAKLIDDAVNDGWHELGIGTAGGGQYCKAFLLATPVASDALGGETVRASGWYRLPEGGAAIPFEAGVPLGDGALTTLAAAVPQTVNLGDGTTARVVFTRYPVAAFDGVDIAQLNRLELGWELLKNLQSDTTARWQLTR